jgi:hypothetical protein
VQPSEASVELSSQPQQLAALVAGAREKYRQSLLTAANSRKLLDEKLRLASEEAETGACRFSPDPALLDRYSQAWTTYGAIGGSPDVAATAPDSLREAEETWAKCSQRCNKQLADYKLLREDYEDGQRRVFGRSKPEPRIPDLFRRDLWEMKGVLDALSDLRRRHVENALKQSTESLTVEFEAESALRDHQLTDFMDRTRSDIAFGIELLGDLGKSWAALIEGNGLAPMTREHGLVRLGRFESVVPQLLPFEVPCVIDFPTTQCLAIEALPENREVALSLARSIVLRALAGIPAGQLNLSIFDPVAMGRSFAEFLHLADFDERLVDTKPRTSAREIESRLEEHTAHLEMVISKYLRGQFSTIREYNLQAQEMAEPYRLLVVCDYPTQFTDRAGELLLSLIENGPRCGIYTLLVHESAASTSTVTSIERLLRTADRVGWHGDHVEVRLAGSEVDLKVVPDSCPEIAFTKDGNPKGEAARFLVTLGQAAQATEERVVDLDHTFELLQRSRASGLANRLPVLEPGSEPIVVSAPATWWSGDTTTGASAILGRAGAQAVAPLYFSSTDIAGGALMVGLPRSGKTTSLHAAILSMSIAYSPQELELYLIDAKHGVEFNSYRNLPHARMVAINNEREFAVAVLNSLDGEIARRAELMKQRAPGRTNLEDYRAVTGDQLPRIVVIIDEFHEIFEEDDRLGQAAFAAFSNIVRQGPFAGVHIVLASQTLSSMPAMDRNTLTLLPARVAFACNESDGQVVMGDTNPDVRFLSRAGEGLLNPSRGDPIANVKFQGTFVTPDRREQIVGQLITKAVETGWHRQPRVFDGDSFADRSMVASEVFTQPSDRALRFRFIAGEPLSLDEYLPVILRRGEGQNIAVIGASDEDGIPEAGLLGMLHSLLIAAAHQIADTQVVDLVNDEGDSLDRGDDRRLSVSDLCSALNVTAHHRRALDAVLRETAHLVAERIALNDYRSPGRLLVLFGVQRASELDPEDYDEDSLSNALQTIMRDGPEVGIHTVLVADGQSALQRRLGTGALDHVAIRIAGRLGSEQERQQILDAYQAIDIRPNQLVIFDRERDQRQKFRPYEPVTHGWLTVAALDAQFQVDVEE